MTHPAGGARRWLVFNAVGLIGFVLQLGVLAVLVHVLDVHYLAATAIAVEVAVLHNFAWHQRLTWRDRLVRSRAGSVARLFRFHLLNGLVSLVGNLGLMRLLAGGLGLDPLFANAVAVVACSVVNFFGSELLVFTARRVAPATAAVLLIAAVPAAASTDALAVELKPATVAAWRTYEQKVDERYQRQTASSSPFFAHDEFRLPEWRQTVRGGGVAMSQLEAPGPGVGRPSVPEGRVHHWVGAVFIPRITVAEVVRRLQEGAGREAGSYQDVLASKLLKKDGDTLSVYLKLRRESVITVVYNTEHAVEYRRLGGARAMSRSVATKIAELADAGTPREREKPSGADRGFLWRLNAYWRYEQVDGGVIVECESISLSRAVPMLLRPFISGVVDGIARDALENTLKSVRGVLSNASARQAI